MCCLAWMQTKHALATHFQASRCLQHRSGTTECEGFPASFPLYNLHLKKDMEKARTRSSCWQESHEVHRADMSKSTGLDHLESGQSTLLEPSVLLCLKDFPPNAPKIRPKLAVKIISAKMPMLEWPWCLPSGSTKTVETPAAFPNAMSSAKCQRETHKCHKCTPCRPDCSATFRACVFNIIQSCSFHWEGHANAARQHWKVSLQPSAALVQGKHPTAKQSFPHMRVKHLLDITILAKRLDTKMVYLRRSRNYKKLSQTFNRIFLGI